MILKWIKKKEMTGWEVSNLTEALRAEFENKSNALYKFTKSYPLAAISLDRNYFVVMRDYLCNTVDDKQNMLNAAAENEESHKGMTLVRILGDAVHARNVILPKGINYRKLELDGDIISIFFDDGKITTNFQEINKLWTFYKLSESEILETFLGFTNEFKEKVKIEKQAAKTIDTDFFGTLTLDDELDSYCGKILLDDTEIQLSFSNFEKKQFDKNLLTTKKAIAKSKELQDSMINEMLELKNDVWLDEDQSIIDKAEFSTEIKLYGLNIYEDGDMEFFYTAGDLFWGHEIASSVDSIGEYLESKLIG